MLSVVYADCRKQKYYAERRYTKCRYAECRLGTMFLSYSQTLDQAEIAGEGQTH
jgi:hypothetical protein